MKSTVHNADNRLPITAWTESRAIAWSLAILSVVTAVIHFAVSGEHFNEYWVFGVFMLVSAWLQLSLALAAVLRPSRLVWWAGALLNGGIIAVYIVTRTVGDVIGPTPNAVEPAGFGDIACTIFEAIVLIGCAWLLVSRRDRRIEPRRMISAVAGVGAVAATLLSVSLVAGGSEMVMTMDSPSANAATANSSGLTLATTSPAGPITTPDPTMQMAPGMKMASSTACDSAPSPAEGKAAVSLVDQSWAADKKYQSLAQAKAAGYVPLTRPGAKVVHYINPTYYRATAHGGPVLDTSAPQSLVYANTPHGAVLVAAMYLSYPGGPSPTPGGCLTQWHVHTNLCIKGKGLRVVGELTTTNSTCPAGSRNRPTPPMLHVWFVPIPGGPLAIDATNSKVVQAAEEVPSPANSRA